MSTDHSSDMGMNDFSVEQNAFEEPMLQQEAESSNTANQNDFGELDSPAVESVEAGELTKFLSRSLFSSEDQTDEERRENDRMDSSLSLLIQPLDHNGACIGSQFCTVSKDVSENGVGFLHTEPIQCDSLRITMISAIGEELTLVGSTKHCSQVGSLGLLYQVGVAF